MEKINTERTRIELYHDVSGIGILYAGCAVVRTRNHTTSIL
jgi:hypothetical protein